MSKVKYIFATVILLSSISVWAQKSKNQKTIIPQEVQKQSYLLADGLRYFYADNYSLAENSFRNVLSINSKNGTAYFMLGKLYSVKKDFVGAVDYLNEAVKLDKKNVWFWAERAKNSANLGNYEAAAKDWEMVCKLDPKSEMFLYQLSDCYLNLAKYREVIKVYDRMEKIVGVSEELTQAKQGLLLYLNDIKAAVAQYDRLIKENPSNADYYVSVGDLYMSNEMSDKAIPYYTEALRIDAGNPGANLAMGAYSLQKGDLEAGFNSVLTAFQSSVLSKEAKLPILRSYMTKAFRTKNTEDIMQASKLAEALATANPEAIEGFASLGSLAVLENHDEEAKIAFEKALAIDNTPYSLWQDYFMVLSRLHDYPAIVQHGEELLSLFPTHALLLFTVGHANYETKNYQTALQYLKRAADYAYDNALLGDIYLMIGDTYQALQDNSEAEKYYKMAENKGKKKKN